MIVKLRASNLHQAFKGEGEPKGLTLQAVALTADATDSIIEMQAEVAQVVEHGTENAGVDSSSLSLGTTP